MDLSVVELEDGRRRVVVSELIRGEEQVFATMSAPISRRAAERLIQDHGKDLPGRVKAEFIAEATAPRNVNRELVESLGEQLRRLGR